MAIAKIYQNSRVAGVRGLRVVEEGVNLAGGSVIRQEPVGYALDTEELVWKTYYLGTSRTLLTDQEIGELFKPAVRVNHPELGSILYVDVADQSKWIMYVGSRIAYERYYEDFGETIYWGENGSIAEQTTSAQKIVFPDGKSYVTFAVPA